MEIKLEDRVSYFQFVHSTVDAAKQNKETQDMPHKQQEKAYLDLPIS